MNEEELNKLKEQLNQVLAESQEKLSTISAIADNSKQKETELNTFHSRIIELKAAAESNLTSITETYNQAVSLKQQIDGLFQAVTTSNQTINQLLQDSTTKTTEIGNYYNSFQDLKQKVENPEHGISSVLNKATEVFSQITKTNEDASKTKEEIIANKIKSEGLVKETDTLKTNVTTNYTESERLKGEIGKILDLVRDTGLANSFDKRRKRSQLSSLYALGVIIAGVILSAYLINKFFLSKEGQELFVSIENDYIKFLLRITLTAPGVFLAWFGATQYSKERHFLEQYEFKTAAALALENYTKLLRQNYGDKKDREIFDLNVELIKSVYKEPDYFRPKSGLSAKLKMPNFSTDASVKKEG